MKKLLLIICCFLFFFTQKSKSQSTNIDFEATLPGVYTTSNAVSGWTISSATATNNCTSANTWTPGSNEFSILNTPVLNIPFIGVIPGSPLGGTTIAQLNSTVANSSCTKLARTITVTPLYNSFHFSYATVLESGHLCCHQPSFFYALKDAQNTTISCPYSLNAPGPSCLNGAVGYSITGNASWTNWQISMIDLSAYTGSVITIEFIINDCTLGDHYATLYLDARLSNSYLNDFASSTLLSSPSPVNFCNGSGIASITAPMGYYSHQWYALNTSFPFSVPLGTTSVLNIPNPIPGATYSLNVINNCGQSSYLYTLTPTTVNINAFEVNPSCSNGTVGSATVIATGSGSGYNYTWKNSSNMIVGTNSVAQNLAPGIYSVVVSAIGSLGCGSSAHVFTVETYPTGLINLTKPFCSGSQASLSISGGTNYQWYNNLTAISPTAGGNSSSFTVASPTLGAIYYLSYTSFTGCKDSIKFTLTPSTPGNISVFQNNLICPEGNNGSVTIGMTAAQGAPSGMRSFHVYSNSLIPPYSASVSPGSQNSFTAYNLLAGQTYSIHASDGFCNYNGTFTVNTLNFDYTLGPTSQTICSGSSLVASINLTGPPLASGYTYSWSPTTFFGNNAGIFPFVSITPTTSLGSSSTFVYSVTVTPKVMNCPLTKTLAVTVTSLVTPSISSIPSFCYNSSHYTVQVNPSGGMFLNNGAPFLKLNSGAISPSLAAIGINTFSYIISSGSCSASTSASFIVNDVSLSISNPTQIYCGQTATLSASGADSYLWSNGNTNSSFTVHPIINTTYTVTGMDSSTNCSKTKATQVIVTQSLVITISGNPTLCLGSSAIISASGAHTYTWNSGAVSPYIYIAPQTPTTYFVMGTDILGCKNNAQFKVFVYPKPVIYVNGNFTVCPGVETTLYASNGLSYVWNTNETTSSIVVSPPLTAIYAVTGKDYYGCTNTKTVTVFVSGCVGVDELNNNDGISIYPNPTTEKLVIESPGKTDLIISDALGKIILEKQLEAGQSILDLKTYNDGIYFIQTIHKGESKTTKVIKAH